MEAPTAVLFTIQNKSYAAVGKLGEGAFGVVYSARDEEGGAVAVKKSSAQEPEDQKDLKREIMIMTQINHESLCGAVGAEVKKRGDTLVALIAMPYASRGNLVAVINKHLQRETDFTERDVLKIMRAVSGGVAELHAQKIPIAHRDLKAENVLCFANGTYRVCDFGSTSTYSFHCQNYRDIAFVEEDLNRKTTLAYRAPEQCDIMGKRRIDQRVDNWALGVMMYLLCYHDCPFPDSAVAICNHPLTIPTPSKYSQDVVELLQWIMNKDADTRPSAQMVHRRCCRLLELDPVAKDPSRTPQPQHPSLSPIPPGGVKPPANATSNAAANRSAARRQQLNFTPPTAGGVQPQVNLFAAAPGGYSSAPSTATTTATANAAAASQGTDLFSQRPGATPVGVGSGGASPVQPQQQAPAPAAKNKLFGMLDWEDSSNAAPAPARAPAVAAAATASPPPRPGVAASPVDDLFGSSSSSPVAAFATHFSPVPAGGAAPVPAASPSGFDDLFPSQSNIDTLLAGGGQPAFPGASPVGSNSPSNTAAVQNDPFSAMMAAPAATPSPPPQRTDLDALFS